MRKALSAAFLAVSAFSMAAPVLADPPPWAPAHGRRAHDDYGDRHDRGYDTRGYEGRGYDGPRRLSRNDRVWRGNDGRYYCRRSNGTTGLVVGAALGGLLGNQVAGRGDRTLGTILGAAGGGLLGREIDRGNVRCR
ncbi:MAG: glycine zipper 2TM domain-containing protein [Sphingomonadales bacterium]|nr:glycine zipper 2TM domain-containing protein [Sphingomonadales bacterium]MDE2170880.1 glycine zipper 2TM domain-containing protein [Sphingomonadales bacterium]